MLPRPAVLIGLAALVAAPGVAAEEPVPCRTREFRTELYRSACEQGQAAARREALRFMKNVIAVKRKAGERNFIIGCQSCHEDLAPDYPLTPTAYELFEEYLALVRAAGRG